MGIRALKKVVEVIRDSKELNETEKIEGLTIILAVINKSIVSGDS